MKSDREQIIHICLQHYWLQCWDWDLSRPATSPWLLL